MSSARARTIAIAGGKGGVGKSTVAVNLALAMGRLGKRVAIVDADLGAANLHTMMGVKKPSGGLAAFLDGQVETLDEVACAVAPNVMLVPGTARPGSANPTHEARVRVMRAIARLAADVVVIDLGAGTSYTVVDLLAASDEKLFVLTPQLASIHNAYALAKACVHRVIRRLATDETERALIDSALAHDHKARSVSALLGVLRPLNEELVARVERTLGKFGAGLVGNQVERAPEAAIFAKISTLIADQLAIEAPVWSTVARSRTLAGNDRGAFGSHREDAIFTSLARGLLGLERAPQERTMPLWLMRDMEAAVG